jgi:Flp pilus assembly pilin Flp
LLSIFANNLSTKEKNMKTKRNLKKGQALTEYLILVALLGIGSIAVVQVLGKNLQVRLADVSDAIQGKPKGHREGASITEDQIRTKDLGDFSDAISDTSQK